MKKDEFILHSFINIQDVIKLFDQKSNVLLIIYGIIASVFFSTIQNTKVVSLINVESNLIILKLIITFVLSFSNILLLIIQVYILIFKVMKPREAQHYPKEKKSLFYYKHISQMERTEFINSIKKISENDLDHEIIDQIYEISKIATQKQENYNKLAKLLFINLILLFCFIFLIHL